MASEVLLKMPAVSFSQVKEMQSGQTELALLALPSGSPPSSSAAEQAALQRAAQLEHNIRFLREQHHLMLSSLHKEVESLRQRNRELQFQLVMSSAAGSAPLALLQDLSSSPEDDSRPKVILSPRQPNLSPLQVEILEKDLAELRIDLKEERDKNQHLSSVVLEQQRRIEHLKAATSATPGTSHRSRDAQIQVGNGSDLSRKLEEAQKMIRTLRKENEEHRRELTSVRTHLNRSHHSNGRTSGGSHQEVELQSLSQADNQHSQRPPSSGGHHFPPLTNTAPSYWQHPHRPGMEYGGGGSRHGGGSRSTNNSNSNNNNRHPPHPHPHQQSGKDLQASSMGGGRSVVNTSSSTSESGGHTRLPALHNNNGMFLFGTSQSHQQQRRRSGHNNNHFHPRGHSNNKQQHSNNNYFRGPAETTTVGGGIESAGGYDGGIQQGRRYSNRGGGGHRGHRQFQ